MIHNCFTNPVASMLKLCDITGHHQIINGTSGTFCQKLLRKYPSLLLLFVVKQGIHDPDQTQEKDGGRGFILLPPQPAELPRSDAGSDGVSQHLVSSSKTVRPIIPRGARCMGQVKIMWSAVCSLAPHSHFVEEARPHLSMDEPKHPTPVRRRLCLTQDVLVKLIPIGLVLTLGM